MRSLLMLFLLCGIFVCPGFAQSRELKTSSQSCLAGISNCDPSSPTKWQSGNIVELSQDQNLLECLTGVGLCDPGPLNTLSGNRWPRQTGNGICLAVCRIWDMRWFIAVSGSDEEVDKLHHQSNFLACEHRGRPLRSVLVDVVGSQGSLDLSHQRNLLQCEIGDLACDPLLLTNSEFTEISDVKHALNLLACKGGEGECDPYLLGALKRSRLKTCGSNETITIVEHYTTIATLRRTE